MERTKKSTAIHWALFFISLAAMLGMLFFTPYGQWFWLILPIVCTSFVQAMDLL